MSEVDRICEKITEFKAYIDELFNRSFNNIGILNNAFQQQMLFLQASHDNILHLLHVYERFRVAECSPLFPEKCPFVLESEVLSSYWGCPYEDPRVFIRQMEAYFSFVNLPQDQKIWLTVTHLKGVAYVWSTCFNTKFVNWNQFVNLFYMEFDGKRVVSILVNELNRTIRETEISQEFVLRQCRLHYRLYPDVAENKRAQYIKTKLSPRISGILENINLQNIQELLYFANQLESLHEHTKVEFLYHQKLSKTTNPNMLKNACGFCKDYDDAETDLHNLVKSDVQTN